MDVREHLREQNDRTLEWIASTHQSVLEATKSYVDSILTIAPQESAASPVDGEAPDPKVLIEESFNFQARVLEENRKFSLALADTWAAAAPGMFDFQAFSAGEFVSALAERLTAESVTRVLYPDDSTSMGQGLRFVQEYFLVACSLADLVRRFRRNNSNWSALPDQVAIQLNDTHPSLAVPELMRILLDEARLGWDEAWDICQGTFAYTNHTVLPEALESWPVDLLGRLLPRHLEIIFEINRRFLDDVRNRTETAMPQAHCFLASELAIRAQDKAATLKPGQHPV